MFNPQEAFFLQWHITDRCNLNCLHCYRDSVKPDLSFNQLQTIFNNFKKLRATIQQKKARVQIAGGEPLLCEHLFPVLDIIAGEGFQSRILTNGVLIDYRTAYEIKRHGCSIVQISIDGTAMTHDAIRGQGNFHRAIEGARYLREQGIEVTFSMTLSKENAFEVASVFEIAKEHAKRLGFHRLVPCGRGVKLKEHLLSKEEVKKIFQEIWSLKSSTSSLEVKLRDPLWKPFIKCLNMEPHVDGCSIAYGGICIDSNADIYPCRRMPIKIGNALEDELRDVWRSPIMTQLRNRDLLKGRCGKCSLRWKCGGCRAIGWAETNDIFAEDPQCFCELSFIEKFSYNLINWLNRDIYNDTYSGGA